MKICFIAPANNYHTQKWCKWFLERGHEIHVISFINAVIPSVEVHHINCGIDVNHSELKKIKYLFYSRRLKIIVDSIKPDIINVHYATSYGTVTALSGIKHYILSVWGTDIYAFPKKSVFHKLMLKYSLNRASCLFSTSKAMAKEVGKYTNKRIEITPFGVDMKLFNPDKRMRVDDNPQFIVGTVKSLSNIYGIDLLLIAVASIRKLRPKLNISVRISGDGVCKKEYEMLAKELKIDDITCFLGYISQEKVAQEWANMDVAIIPSRYYESFGVSAIEAEACGTPIIISDVEGLMETTVANESSKVVPRGDSNAITVALLELYDNPEERKNMGIRGRKFVEKNFEINDCFLKIENMYKEFMIQ